MIVISGVLLFVAAVLLVIGLIPSMGLHWVYAAIVTSALSFVTLWLAVRRTRDEIVAVDGTAASEDAPFNQVSDASFSEVQVVPATAPERAADATHPLDEATVTIVPPVPTAPTVTEPAAVADSPAVVIATPVESGSAVNRLRDGSPPVAAPAPAKRAAPVKAAQVKKVAPAKSAKRAAPAVPAVAVKRVAPAKPAVAAKRGAPAKSAVAAKQAAPAKPAVAAKKAVPVKKAAPAKSAVAAKRAASAKPAVAAKKAVPVKKAAPAKSAVAAKRAAPAKPAVAAKKAAPRRRT